MFSDLTLSSPIGVKTTGVASYNEGIYENTFEMNVFENNLTIVTIGAKNIDEEGNSYPTIFNSLSASDFEIESEYSATYLEIINGELYITINALGNFRNGYN